MTEPTHDQGQDAGRPADQPEGHAARDAQPAPPPTPEESPEERAARVEVRKTVALRREDALDADHPSSLRERIAYATELARAGILPKAFRASRGGEEGFRETAANVLLAIDAGNDLGLTPMASLRLINVVEGKPSLGAEGVRACVLNAGHDLWTDAESPVRNEYGIPVSATVHGKRHDRERVYSATFTIDQAAAAGLCAVERDDDGVVRVVRARSQSGKVLPWEAYTGDMLENRATTKLARRAFPDVTGGLSYERDELAPETVAQPGPPPARAQRATPSQDAQPPSGPQAEDPVEADLALFSDTAGNGPWWQHAGAAVRRRNKLQLAADRLAELAEAGDPRVPPREDIVDAVVVEDAPTAPAEPASPAAAPTAPQEATDAQATSPDPVVIDGAAEAQELEQSLVGLPGPGADEPWPGDPDYDGSAEDVGTVPEPAGLDRADLWAEVEALATARGKSPAQLMARWTLANRCNPEDATAEQLDAFLEPYRELGANQ